MNERGRDAMIIELTKKDMYRYIEKLYMKHLIQTKGEGAQGRDVGT